MKHLRTFWFTSTSSIGLVVGEDEITGQRKGYIGGATGQDEKADEKLIMDWGSPINVSVLEEIVSLMKGTSGEGDGRGSQKTE